MIDSEKQYFEDMLFKAVQSGKQETSGLVAHLANKMDAAVGRSVEKHSNGYWRETQQILKEQNIVLREIQAEQARVRLELQNLKNDNIKIKADTDTIVKAKDGASILGKLVIWVAAVISAILVVFIMVFLFFAELLPANQPSPDQF